MPFTQYTSLDFDQIRTSIKDYLRSNSDFSDFDFDGSNFSVLIDTLAYNTYITAFNSNMIVNESFLDSATVRENVVSLARNIGYVPRSRNAAKAIIDLTMTTSLSSSEKIPQVKLHKGLVCIGNDSEDSYIFSLVDDISASKIERIDDNTIEIKFENLEIYQGTLVKKYFTYQANTKDQRFILNNPNIDSASIRVKVGKENDAGMTYLQSDNIVDINADSRIYFTQEIQDGEYELIFGDNYFGKKPQDISAGGDGTTISTSYIVTDGESGNGVESLSFSGTVSKKDSDGDDIILTNLNIVDRSGNEGLVVTQKSINGSSAETIDSIRYYAPRLYSSQYRAVTAKDYESIVKNVYPDTESISVVGGEELDPPEYGNVLISIKPKNGTFVSDFNKSKILSDLKKYTITGINQKIIDLKLLYIELDSSIYYDSSAISNAPDVKTRIIESLEKYSSSKDLNKFGGRFKYSKVLSLIDRVNRGITSNITKVIMRRDMKASINLSAQYELCFGNQFYVKKEGKNVKSTGFKILGESDFVYITDIPNEDKKTGIISIVKNDSNNTVIVKSAGTVDYVKGEVILNTLTITSTELSGNIIEIQANPDSNDIVGLRDLYLVLDISKSRINMLRDVISSGEELSGTEFTKKYYSSSYSNGSLIRE